VDQPQALPDEAFIELNDLLQNPTNDLDLNVELEDNLQGIEDLIQAADNLEAGNAFQMLGGCLRMLSMLVLSEDLSSRVAESTRLILVKDGFGGD
jgi:hypothetical protein